MGSEEVDHVESLVLGPRLPVEAFDHAAEVEGGAIGNVAERLAVAASTGEVDHGPAQPPA